MERNHPTRAFQYNEDNPMQKIYDALYQDSLNTRNFNSLMDLITRKENILLAYQNVRKNFGNYTTKTNGSGIEDIEKLSPNEIVNNIRCYIEGSAHGYRPKPVEIINIRQVDGELRQTSTVNTWDCIIQQSVRQVLEPICEAKFSKNSYGFRPDTTVEHALASCYKLMQIQKCKYVIEIDLESCLCNINHGKLIKQLWTMGIRDKRLLCVLRRMLRTPVKCGKAGTTIPKKGIAQCGALSSLFANIYLNEFDQWIDSQWQDHPISRKYANDRTKEGKGIDKSWGYKKMRKTHLKEVYIVRYSGSIRLFTKNYNDAKRIKIASKLWIKERLRLDIAQEIRIIDTTRKFAEFLGFKMRLRNKRNTLTVESHISDKSFKNIKNKLAGQIKNIAKPNRRNRTLYDEVRLYNTMVIEIQEYYKIATDIQIDLDRMSWDLMKRIKNRTSSESGGRLKKTGRQLSQFENSRFGKSKSVRYISIRDDYSEPIYPISYISTKHPMCKSNKINRYTEEGRKALNKKRTSINIKLLCKIMKSDSYDYSENLINNKISAFIGQNGKCAITGAIFTNTKDMECHHVIPKKDGGTDERKNLILVKPEIHKLIHATNRQTVNKYLQELNLNEQEIKKINKYREHCGNDPI